jgi:hypothetical protein
LKVKGEIALSVVFSLFLPLFFLEEFGLLGYIFSVISDKSKLLLLLGENPDVLQKLSMKFFFSSDDIDLSSSGKKLIFFFLKISYYFFLYPTY